MVVMASSSVAVSAGAADLTLLAFLTGGCGTCQAFWKGLSSRANPSALTADPANDLFGRFDMRRLTAEEIRDTLLSLSGTLNLNQSSHAGGGGTSDTGTAGVGGNAASSLTDADSAASTLNAAASSYGGAGGGTASGAAANGGTATTSETITSIGTRPTLSTWNRTTANTTYKSPSNEPVRSIRSDRPASRP